MSEHKRTHQQKTREANQEHGSRQKETKLVIEPFHTREQRKSLTGETPFWPLLEQHTILLESAHSAGEKANQLIQVQLPQQRDILKACLNYPVNAYLCPLVAAGYLARLGSPEGFLAIVRSFEVDNLIVRMVVCKQLYFFVPYHGVEGSDGHPIDVFSLIARALHDENRDLQLAALIQLRELLTAETRKILEVYIRNISDEHLPSIALNVLNRITKWATKLYSIAENTLFHPHLAY